MAMPHGNPGHLWSSAKRFCFRGASHLRSVFLSAHSPDLPSLMPRRKPSQAILPVTMVQRWPRMAFVK